MLKFKILQTQNPDVLIESKLNGIFPSQTSVVYCSFSSSVSSSVGSPIPVTKSLTPSQEYIDEVHQQYKDQLTELFDQHKTRFGVSETTKLEFY